MDNICNIDFNNKTYSFPLQQSDELLFQISSNTQQLDKISQDLLFGDSNCMEDIDTTIKGKTRLRKSRSVVEKNNIHHDHDNIASTSHDDVNKKTMHREIEKQRRQEMASLYASLRSLLPLQYIKGKRSTSDHMKEAVNYIKDLENEIGQVSAKRDEYLTRLEAFNSEPGSSSDVSFLPRLVYVECSGGVHLKIAFNGGFGDDALPLSKVLQVVLEQGISVCNCVSTKANDCLLHTIQAEVVDQTSFDFSSLELKLNSLFPSIESSEPVTNIDCDYYISHFCMENGEFADS